MIKRIAQLINEANLILEGKAPSPKALSIDAVGGEDIWNQLTDNERRRVIDYFGSDVFHGEDPHKYSSPNWLQPMVESEQINNIISAISHTKSGELALFTLSQLRKDRWGDTPNHVIRRENLKSIIRFLLRPHYSSGGAGVASDDETTDADTEWISQIDNQSWLGLKNILFQILLPILKDSGYDISPELEHEDISNSPWDWLKSPIWPWMR